MTVPDFSTPDLAIKMMNKGVNPFVIPDLVIQKKLFPSSDEIHFHADTNQKRYSQVKKYPSSFESDEAKSLLCQFSTSVHYSLEDIECGQTCSGDCPSKFKKFYQKNGALVQMTDENKIGTGDFGKVYAELFHDISMAMKCVWTGQITYKSGDTIKDAVSYLNKNLSEIRKQIETVGSGILLPVAVVRQQDQEKDEQGEWIPFNFNIFIYPLYDFNLYELHENHFSQFTEEILSDILSQCLTRKCSVEFLYYIGFTQCACSQCSQM